MHFLQSLSWLLLTTLTAVRAVTPSPTGGPEPISALVSKTSISQAPARPTVPGGSPCAIVSEKIKAVLAASPSGIMLHTVGKTGLTRHSYAR
jgi:hypothetical protein